MELRQSSLCTTEPIKLKEIEAMQCTPDNLTVLTYERIKQEKLDKKELSRIFSNFKITVLETDTFCLHKGRGPALLIKDGKLGIDSRDNGYNTKTLNKKAYIIINALSMEGFVVKPRRKRVFFKSYKTRNTYRPRQMGIF